MNKFLILCLLILTIHPAGLVAQSNEFRTTPEFTVALDYDNVGSTTASFRAGGRTFYGIVGLGYNWRAISDDAMVWKVGAGAHIGHGFLFNTDIELKASFYSTFKEIKTTQYTLSLLPGLKLTDRFEIYIGPDVSYLQSKHTNNHNLLKKGITLWDNENSSRLQHLYIGFTTGIRYRF